ncbi:hypothetical protein GGI25_006437, partial [Coemansia spiralis]
HVGWMLIYLLAYPIWSFVLPVYSFWHMDDFSWGNTRVVVGDGKRKIIVADDKPFDPQSIPQRRWMEYEVELANAGVLNAPPPNMNPNASSSREDERMSMYSRQSQIMMPGNPRVGSVYGYPPTAPSAVGFNGAHANQYAMMGSTRPGTPAATTPGVLDQRFSMAGTITPMTSGYTPYAMNTQAQASASLPSEMVPTRRGSVYGAIASAAEYTIRSPSPPAITASAQNSTMPNYNTLNQSAAAFTNQTVSQEYVISGSASISDAMYQQHKYRPRSSLAGMASFSATENSGYGSTISDAQLIEAIRLILASSDLTSLTKKKVRQQLSHDFNMDLTNRKDFISDVVDRMLSGTL